MSLILYRCAKPFAALTEKASVGIVPKWFNVWNITWKNVDDWDSLHTRNSSNANAILNPKDYLFGAYPQILLIAV
jgi:hypothetical protein